MNDSAGRSSPAHHAWDALVGRRAGHDTTVTEHVGTCAPRHWLHGPGKRCSGAIGDWGTREADQSHSHRCDGSVWNSLYTRLTNCL